MKIGWISRAKSTVEVGAAAAALGDPFRTPTARVRIAKIPVSAIDRFGTFDMARPVYSFRINLSWSFQFEIASGWALVAGKNGCANCAG